MHATYSHHPCSLISAARIRIHSNSSSDSSTAHAVYAYRCWRAIHNQPGWAPGSRNAAKALLRPGGHTTKKDWT
eukprot:2387838-Alexandrium_andersonii.AAC.1